jgi:hypothetical protein
MKTYTATVILTAPRKVTLTFPDDTIIQDVYEAFENEGTNFLWDEKAPDSESYHVTGLEQTA